MKDSTIEENASFLIWSYDPCYEGGWHIVDTAFTLEEAEGKCRKAHEDGVKRVEESRAYLKEAGREDDQDPRVLACYKSSMVTSNKVFGLEIL